MANIFQNIGRRLKDVALAGFHQVYTGDNGQTARSYLDEEERRRREEQQRAQLARQQMSQRNAGDTGGLKVDVARPTARLSIGQPQNNAPTTLKVGAPAATPTIKVPQVTPPPAPKPSQTFKGFTMDQGKNKTIFGKNAAWLLPKQFEKTYGVKVDRNVDLDHDTFMSQYDKLGDDFKKVYTNQVIEQAKKGDQAAVTTLKALTDSGRMKGNVNDFIEGANERLYGGISRGGLRLADLALPGKNTFGLERLADQQDPSKTGTRQFTQRGKQGEVFGTVEKGIVDLAAIALPGAAADKGVEAIERANQARKLIAAAQKLGLSVEDANMLINSGVKIEHATGKARQFLTYAARIAPGSLTGTAIDALQTKGRGEDVNIGKSAGIGLATDVALPAVLKPVEKYGGKLIRKGLQFAGDKITPKAEALAEENANDLLDHSLTWQNFRRNLDVPSADELAGLRFAESTPTAPAVNAPQQAYSQDVEDFLKQVEQERPDVTIDRKLSEEDLVNSVNDQLAKQTPTAGAPSVVPDTTPNLTPRDAGQPVPAPAATPAKVDDGIVAEHASPLGGTVGRYDGRSILDKYTPGANRAPEETEAINWLARNPEEAMRRYDERVMQEFGVSTPNVVAGDEAKFIIPGFDASKSGAYHEPGSALAKVKYDQLLSNPATKDKPVLLMAGGTGAGKTSSLKSTLSKTGSALEDYAAVVDTNSNVLESADQKIQQALATGRQVDIVYVYRDPITAFESGVLPRAQKIGRIVPLDAHISTHTGSLNAMRELQARYADNPHVNIEVISNTGATPAEAFLSSLDQLPTEGYNDTQLRNSLEELVRREQAQGKITDEEAATYFGRQAEGAKNGVQTPTQPSSVRIAARPNQELINQGLVEPGVREIRTSKLKLGSDSLDEIDPAQTQKYIEDILAGRPIDPIIVSRGEGGQLFIQDGKHRWEAARQLGIQDVPVSMQPTAEARKALRGAESASKAVTDINQSSTVDDLHPELQDFVRGYADHLQSQEAGLRGGMLVDDGEAYGYGKVRTTEHSPFYREYFKANGRAPSKQAWIDHAYDEIRGGRSEFQSEFEALQRDVNDPELQSLFARQFENVDQPAANTGMALDTGGMQFEDLPITPGARPELDLSGSRISRKTPGRQKAGFAQSVQDAVDEVSGDTRRRIRAGYVPKTNDELTDAAEALLADGDIRGAERHVYDSLSKPVGEINDQDVTNAIFLAKTLDSEGDFDGASQLYDKLAEHLTAAGRTVQAASLLSRRSPEGLQMAAQRDLKKAGVSLDKVLNEETGETVLDRLQQNIEAIRGTQEGSLERDLAVHNLAQFVDSNVPKSLSKKLVTTWKAGLLTAPTTTAGNILSNTIETIGKKLTIDPVAAALDRAFSVFTGERSKLFTVRGLAGGAREGGAAAKEYFKTGFDPTRSLSKYDMKGDVVFNPDTNAGKFLNAYTGTVFRALGAQDKPFYYANLRNSLTERAMLAARNSGLTGDDAAQFVQKFIDEPPQEAAQAAADDAARAVFGNQTWLSKKANALRQGEGGAGVEFLIPFTGVPSSIATRILERTPVGALKEIVSQMKAGKLDQRTMVEALSNSAVGTGGALLIGKELVDHDMITLGYPQDERERRLWEMEGKQPYSVRFGNKWYSLNYVQPFGSILAAGAQYSQSRKDGDSIGASIAAAAAQAGKSVTGQSFLQGVSGALEAIQDPKRSAETFVNKTVGSIVPNFIRRGAMALDDTQRQIDNPIDAIKAGIPGLRESVPEKMGLNGEPLPRQTNAFESFFSPLKPSDVRGDATVEELRRLDNADFGIVPSTIDAKTKFDGVETTLSREQRNTLQQRIGDQVKQAWDQLMATPEYKAMSDEDKKKALEGISGDFAAVEKRKFAAENQLGQYSPGYTGEQKPLSSKQDAILNGGFDVSNYTSTSGVGRLSPQLSDASKNTLRTIEGMPAEKKEKYLKDPKNNYMYQLSKYENDLRNGKLSEVDQYEKLQSLGKMKIQSKYSAEAVELYGLSKKKLQDFSEKRGIKQAVLNEVLAMDQELAAAGFTSKPKFGGSGGSGGSGGGGGGKKAKQPPHPQFGSFRLVEPPTSPRPTINSVLADFQKLVSGIAVLQGQGVAPGDDTSKIEINV